VEGSIASDRRYDRYAHALKSCKIEPDPCLIANGGFPHAGGLEAARGPLSSAHILLRHLPLDSLPARRLAGWQLAFPYALSHDAHKGPKPPRFGLIAVGPALHSGLDEPDGRLDQPQYAAGRLRSNVGYLMGAYKFCRQ